MVRLWFLLHYLNSAKRPTSTGVPSWYRNEIRQGEFVDYLTYNIGFLRDWKSTLRNFYYKRVIKWWSSKSDQREVDRIHNQRRLINDLIKKAKEDHLIDCRSTTPNPVDSELLIEINWKGRQFLNPLYFTNYFFKEFKPILTFISGSIGLLILQSLYRLLFS